MAANVLFESNVPGYPVRRGKVRDVYDLEDRLVIVATDRISAFDWVMPTPIPDKGRILTTMTRFWLEWLKVPNHYISTELADMPGAFQAKRDQLTGRTMLVHKAEVVPIECVVRGYLSGSAWKEYRNTGTVCGKELPTGMRESEAFREPIFTPATKAATGHDENITFDEMAHRVGRDTAEMLRERSLDVYRRAAAYARAKGVIIADTKLEWGRLLNGQMILVDEVLTPDSSRFWPQAGYRPGVPQPSFDKQFLRDWLETTGWDKNSTPPQLPPEVVEQTRAKYLDALRLLTSP